MDIRNFNNLINSPNLNLKQQDTKKLIVALAFGITCCAKKEIVFSGSLGKLIATGLFFCSMAYFLKPSFQTETQKFVNKIKANKNPGKMTSNFPNMSVKNTSAYLSLDDLILADFYNIVILFPVFCKIISSTGHNNNSENQTFIDVVCESVIQESDIRKNITEMGVSLKIELKKNQENPCVFNLAIEKRRPMCYVDTQAFLLNQADQKVFTKGLESCAALAFRVGNQNFLAHITPLQKFIEDVRNYIIKNIDASKLSQAGISIWVGDYNYHLGENTYLTYNDLDELPKAITIMRSFKNIMQMLNSLNLSENVMQVSLVSPSVNVGISEDGCHFLCFG